MQLFRQININVYLKMVGLDAAGKTTILYKLKLGKIGQYAATDTADGHRGK